MVIYMTSVSKEIFIVQLYFNTKSMNNLNVCLMDWVDDAIQSSHPLLTSHPRSFPASGSFPVSQLFVSSDQSIGPSASMLQQSIEHSPSVLPMNIQDWFPLGLTGFISLLSKELSRVFSITTVNKYQFFGAQPSLWSNSHICTWLMEKP